MIYPGAVWSPGVNAGYAAGRTSMTAAVCHYTVGRDSRPIGLRGYFNFLVSRDGTVTQFAEADAVCWHAGAPWNFRGPGIEVEYLPGVDDDIFTPEALAACGALVRWLGIPLAFYDGPRIADWSGFITHRSLIQTGDAHSDYWTEQDWAAMTATKPAPPLPISPQEATVPFKMHSPTRAAVVTEDEVYVVGYGGTMAFVEVDDATFDFVVADVRAKRVEGRKVRQVRG